MFLACFSLVSREGRKEAGKSRPSKRKDETPQKRFATTCRRPITLFLGFLRPLGEPKFNFGQVVLFFRDIGASLSIAMFDNVVFPRPGQPLREAAIKEVVRGKVRRKGEPLFRRKRAVGTYFLIFFGNRGCEKDPKAIKRGRCECKLERAALAGHRCV